MQIKLAWINWFNSMWLTGFKFHLYVYNTIYNIDVDHSRQIRNFLGRMESDISETFHTGFFSAQKFSKRQSQLKISPTVSRTNTFDLSTNTFPTWCGMVNKYVCIWLNEYASVEVIIINWCDFYYIYRVEEFFFTQDTDAYSGNL